MKRIFFLIILFTSTINCKSQEIVNTKKDISKKIDTKPKLIVGIVVDQMRYDYLARFYNNFSDGGFKRLMNDGYNLKNTHYNYVPTKTAIGHASIYTGTTPENHGIMGNDWYDKYLKKRVYCVRDDNYQTLGSKSKEGEMSPHRLRTTTVGDQLHLAQNMNGKVIAVSIKNRGSVLPGGHTANAAYWFDDKQVGQWISSSYYMDELPNWVKKINASDTFENYLSKPWNTYLDIDKYVSSHQDDNSYEDPFEGSEKPIFPHNIQNLRVENNNFLLLRITPFGNNLTTDFAIKAIENEQLGKSKFTDFLAISYTSTDEVGHRFGPNSIELEDTFIRLDRDIERLLNYLDSNVGVNNYTLFLTSDHGVTEVPKFLTDIKIPAGYKSKKQTLKKVKDLTKTHFGEDLVEDLMNNQVYLNHDKIKELNIDTNEVIEVLLNEMITYKNIYKITSAKTLQNTEFTRGIMGMIQRGYNQKFSGDIIFVETPSTLSDWYLKLEATNHGSPYNYDTHVPLLFYGKGIKKGSSHQYHPIIDIAPTLSALLGIEFPNGSTGKVIEKVLE